MPLPHQCWDYKHLPACLDFLNVGSEAQTLELMFDWQVSHVSPASILRLLRKPGTIPWLQSDAFRFLILLRRMTETLKTRNAVTLQLTSDLSTKWTYNRPGASRRYYLQVC